MYGLIAFCSPDRSTVIFIAYCLESAAVIVCGTMVIGSASAARNAAQRLKCIIQIAPFKMRRMLSAPDPVSHLPAAVFSASFRPDLARPPCNTYSIAASDVRRHDENLLENPTTSRHETGSLCSAATPAAASRIIPSRLSLYQFLRHFTIQYCDRFRDICE